VEIKRFLGIRNTTSPERFKVGEMQSASDVDTDNTGRLLTRKGQQLVVSASGAHSLYANHILAVMAVGNQLRLRQNSTTWNTIATLSSSDPISYATVLDTVYFSNGTDKGRIVNGAVRQWGVTPPVSQPQATATVGDLPPGNYMYALTFLRSDGHESGTGLAGSIDLPQGGGIAFSNIEISTNPEISDKIVYLSGSNGEVLYKALLLPNSQPQAAYTGTGLDLSIPLITQFAEPPPAGTIVREYNGVMYVVSGSAVFHSDPYAMELFRPDTNYLQFTAPVAMFEGVNDGVYVATVDLEGDDQETSSGTWFLMGGGPSKFQPVKLFDYGAIPRSSVLTEASYFESQPQAEAEGSQARPAVLWVSRHGVVLGRDSANVQNLTEAVYCFPSAAVAAGMVRQHRGYVNYVVTLQGVGSANNKYVGG
jgi:hypothetical protein